LGQQAVAVADDGNAVVAGRLGYGVRACMARAKDSARSV
jgi:hypothetical protein